MLRRSPRHSPTHHTPGLIAIAVAFLLGLVVLTTVMIHTTIMEERRERTTALADSLIGQTDSLFAAIPDLTSGELRRMRRYLNQNHVDRAQRLGVSAPSTRAAATELSAQDKLVLLDADEYYHVRPMDYSVPYVTDDAAHLLAIIGHRFQKHLADAGVPPYRYVITSGTRSKEDQRALRRINANAVPTSSHNYGTTVDLHYRAFRYASAQDSIPTPDGILPGMLRDRMQTAYNNFGEIYHEKLKAVLGRVLLDLQNDGKVLIIYERRQPVYHITVAERIDRPMFAQLDHPSAADARADRLDPPRSQAQSEDARRLAGGAGTTSTP